MRTLLFLLVFVAVAFGQQPIEITDFSGGLVRLMDPYDMPDNAAREYTNVSLKSVGGLSVRDGYTRMAQGDSIFRVVASEPRDVTELTAQYFPESKCLIYSRGADEIIGYGGAEAYMHGYFILKGGNTDTLKFQWVASDMFGSLDTDYEIESALWNNNLIIARRNTEMVVYDGSKMFPATPLGPGQIVTHAGENIHTLTGNYQYAYNYSRTQSDLVNHTGLSLESLSLEVREGRVWMRGFVTTAFPDSFPYIKIYRSNPDSTDPAFYKMSWINWDDTIARDDDMTLVVGDTDPEPVSRVLKYYCAPGQPVFDTIPNLAGPGPGHTDSGISNQEVTYQIVYRDSSGRWTKIRDPQEYNMPHYSVPTALPESVKIVLTHIPVPQEPHNIAKKYIIREHRHNFHFDSSIDRNTRGIWWLIDSIGLEDTMYTDDKDTRYVVDSLSIFTTVDDSILTFRPSSIVLNGSRIFAVGNPRARNTLYYSEFGKPTTFPVEHLIQIQSGIGDWAQRLYVLRDRMLLFRQNSVVLITGLSFFQFRILEIARNVGLTGFRTLAGTNDFAVFAHTAGVYITDGNSPIKISQSIQSYWDSLTTEEIRASNAGIIEDEYWLSIPGRNSLVYNFTYQQWREYSFEFDAIIQYALDSGDYNYSTDYVFVRNDSLYELSDTLVADNGEQIFVTWQSKTYFQEDGRVRVNYIDFEGQGGCDSINLYGYLDNGATLAKKQLTDINWFGQGGSRRDYAKDNRITFKEIVNTFSFKIEIYGPSNKWLLSKMTLNYTQWDEGIE